jgi:hypothetical protein
MIARNEEPVTTVKKNDSSPRRSRRRDQLAPGRQADAARRQVVRALRRLHRREHGARAARQRRAGEWDLTLDLLPTLPGGDDDGARVASRRGCRSSA